MEHAMTRGMAVRPIVFDWLRGRRGHPGQAGVRRSFLFQALNVMPQLVRGIHAWVGKQPCRRHRAFRQIFPYGDVGRPESA
jgi:hypothetical protein